MLKLSDYIFYRVYLFYLQDRNPETVRSYASGFLAMVQFFTILSAYGISSLFYKYRIDNQLIYGLVAIILFTLNWYRYERKISLPDLEKRFGYEDTGVKKRKGIYLTIHVILVLLTPMIIGYLRHNIGIIN